jgi:hypothetical protein
MVVASAVVTLFGVARRRTVAARSKPAIHAAAAPLAGLTTAKGPR